MDYLDGYPDIHVHIVMELRHHISSLPNHVHEQTGNILNVHVQTGTAAAATGLTNDAYVQTGNILWDDGQTSLGKHLGRLYGTLLAFPLLILFSSSSWCIYYHSRNRTCSQPPSSFTCLVLSQRWCYGLRATATMHMLR